MTKERSFTFNVTNLMNLAKNITFRTYLFCTLDETSLIAPPTCYWALGEQRNRGEIKRELYIERKYILHTALQLLHLSNILDLPLAMWRQTTGLCVVSDSVWWSRILDWQVLAGLSTNCLAVCVPGHLGWFLYTALSSSSSRCHTFENTAK